MNDPKFRFGSDDQLIHREKGYVVPDDEPVFTLRGKDLVGTLTLVNYINECQDELSVTSEIDVEKRNLLADHIVGAEERLAAFRSYREKYPHRIGRACSS